MFVEMYVKAADNPTIRSCFEAQASGNSVGKDFIGSVFRKLESAIQLHGLAFDRGLIPCKKLVNLTVPIFLKLARKSNLEIPPGIPFADRQVVAMNNIGDDMLLRWKDSFQETILGKPDQEKILRPKKRQELVKGLLAANFPEVRSKYRRV